MTAVDIQTQLCIAVIVADKSTHIQYMTNSLRFFSRASFYCCTSRSPSKTLLERGPPGTGGNHVKARRARKAGWRAPRNGADAVGKHVTESGRRVVQARQASGRQGRQAGSKGLHGGSSQEARPVDQGGLVGKTQGRRSVSGFGPGKLPQEVGSLGAPSATNLDPKDARGRSAPSDAARQAKQRAAPSHGGSAERHHA